MCGHVSFRDKASREMEFFLLNSVGIFTRKCGVQEGKTPKECLREGHCKALQVTFFECKRSILDNRARFRGRKGY
ncbi:cytochrome c oxidase assembly factor 5 isoform X2 [Engystomops pustulosus]|uniref:cytochrome c oxidase assembly factor 5 isoform X2 n=1 Tax=Engystomops pustulosus TaxID=76066 RepID=UPI003AFA1F19